MILAPVPGTPAGPVTAGDHFDEALEVLAGTGPEFGPGLSNHGPMAAEALGQMGRGTEVVGWAARYRERLDHAPSRGRVVPAAAVEAALGAYRRFPDFVAFFEAALEEQEAKAVLAQWVPRLAPGAVAAAGHGLLRVAHATRALRAADQPGRRRELAQGLAYWAARYQELPGPPLLLGQGTVAGQLAALPSLDPALDEFLITERLRHLIDVADEFEAVVVGLEPPADPVLALDLVAVGGAAAYLRNADHAAIALIHAVTVPMAVELLLDALAPDDQLEVFAYAWQAAAALHVGFADHRQPTVDEALTDQPYPEDLVAAALESGDEHAIKLTEASLRAYRRTGEPVLLMAARDASNRLG